MNIIDLLLLAVVFISVALAVYRGFLASLLGLLACMASLLFAFLVGPQLAQQLGGNQNVANLLATYTDAGSLIGDYSLSVIPAAALDESIVETVMKNISLPPLVRDILRQNLLADALSNTAYTLNDYVTSTIVTVLLQAGSFMVCYFVCFLALHLMINLVDHVFYFPVLRHFDWLMAAVMGVLRGIAVVWVLLLVVPVVRMVIPFDLLETYLGQSKLLPLIDSDAFFLRVVQGL